MATTLLLATLFSDDARIQSISTYLGVCGIFRPAVGLASLESKHVVFIGLINARISHVYVLGWWEST